MRIVVLLQNSKLRYQRALHARQGVVRPALSRTASPHRGRRSALRGVRARNW